MRRQDAREGVEFGFNDFSPALKGRVAPSPSRGRVTINKTGRRLFLALLFVFIGLILTVFFSSLNHRSNQGGVSSAFAYAVEKEDELRHQLRQRVDSLIQKIDDFVDED